jgi:rubrerythrin
VGNTSGNLNEAFAGESKANRMYTAFAKKADEEGHKQVAKLFRAAAAAETVHALNHLNAMDAVKDTVENLKLAVHGEHHEFQSMYPAFIKDAETENAKGAKWTFDVASKVEQIHHGLYSAALEALEKGEDVPGTEYYVCGICGNTVEGEAPDKCPICRAAKARFTRVE